MHINNWLAFCSIAFIATITPGPAVLLVATHSLRFGTQKTLLTIAGNVSGLFIMSACSVLGLSALVVYSAAAFTTIKIIGALYLFYIGIKLWRNGIDFNCQQKTNDFAALNLYSQGLFVALTNPKAIIFTTALFPQFINVAEPLIPQFSILVITFMALSALCLIAYSHMFKRTKSYSHKYFSEKISGKFIGAGFIGASATLLSTSQR